MTSASCMFLSTSEFHFCIDDFLCFGHSAGQTGPVSPFFNDTSAPEHANINTLGRALFENESPSSWANLYSINTFPVFFVTTAFLGLLDKGAREKEGSLSCVINVTSISGVIKLAQNHVIF
jgi:hypothetical protein